MLDQWISGNVSRISPEAPVSIFKRKNDNYNIGGAGNVAVNLDSLEIPVKLYGTVGNDFEGKIIKKLLKKKKIKNSIKLTNDYTTVKTRIISEKGKHIIRIDREKISNKDFFSSFYNDLNNKELIIISDYKKGVINSKTVKKILRKNKMILVDPKNNFKYYKNAFLVKPNMSEFLSWVNSKKFKWSDASSLIKKMKWTWLVITNGSNGMYLINNKLEKKHFKFKAKKIGDVSGAGDITLASLAFYIFNNFNIFESAKLACEIATKYVETKRITSINKKNLNHKIVFTNGCFDILHKGHYKLLKFAKSLGNKLIVGLNSDDSVKKLKGFNRPINNVNQRIKNLYNLSLVDEIIVFNETTPLNLIKKIKPNIIVKGSDYSKKKISGSKISNVKIFPLIKGLSTTKIINNKK